MARTRSDLQREIDITDGNGTGRTPSQILTTVLGVVEVLIGIAGFFVTDQFIGNTDQTLLVFEVNHLHNIVHLLLGVLALAMARTDRTARTYGWLLVAGYGVVALYGFIAGNDESLLSLNSADNVLHVLLILAGLAIALWPRERRTA
jgi:hypothetical protein